MENLGGLLPSENGSGIIRCPLRSPPDGAAEAEADEAEAAEADAAAAPTAAARARTPGIQYFGCVRLRPSADTLLKDFVQGIV